MKKQIETTLIGTATLTSLTFIFLLMIVLFACQKGTGDTADSDIPQSFQKTLEGGQAASFVQANDDGFIVASAIDSGGNSDACLVKLNARGETLWAKTFGSSGPDYFVSVNQTKDGGFIAAGITYGFGLGNSDVYLVKTDGNGNLQWSKTYGGTGYDNVNAVEQTADGGFFVTGGVDYVGSFYFKTDPMGNLVWSKLISGVVIYNTVGEQTNDGGFIIACDAYDQFGSGLYSMFLAKLDTNGDTIWTRNFGGLNFQGARAVRQVPDAGYLLAGGTQSFGAGNYDFYIVKTDLSGNLQWSKTIGGTQDDYCLDVSVCKDESFLMAGSTQSFGAGNEDIFLVKLDINGNLLWSKCYGTSYYEAALHIKLSNDGGYLLGGYNADFLSNTFHAAYIIKTDSTGESGCNQSIPAPFVSSPATLVFHIPIALTSYGTVTNPATVVSSGAPITSLCN